MIAAPGQTLWRLDAPLVYQIAPNHLITVPAGELTDLASVPWYLRSITLSDPHTAWAAVVHDYLYKTQTVPRPLADAVFYGALRDSGVSKFWSAVYYAAVRMGGWRIWYQRRKATR